MKILWVKAGGLLPLDVGGRIRSYYILKELARRHEVTFFTFCAEEPDDPHAQLESVFSRVVCVNLRLPAPKSASEAFFYLRCLLSLQPYQVAKYCQPEVARTLREMMRSNTYDLVVCDFALAGGVIPWEDPSPKVLFTHNVEAIIWKRHFQVARNPLWKAICYREYRAMARAERSFIKRADHVLTVSEADRDFFSPLVNQQKLTVIPTGVDIDYFEPTSESGDPGTIVFTGSMDWMPNEDGIFYFVREILPHISRQVPDVTLWVVGRSPSARLRTLAEGNRAVRVTGRVEDIRPYVRRACVYIVPLRVGGGTRLKIFEAMAMGKAVVSTSIGAEGLPVRHGDNIILADDPATFSSEVVRLLNDPAGRNELGRAARRLVADNYSWAAAGKQFESVLLQLL